MTGTFIVEELPIAAVNLGGRLVDSAPPRTCALDPGACFHLERSCFSLLVACTAERNRSRGPREERYMDYDEDKVDEIVLALLSLTMFPDAGTTRAWKGYPWEALDRLHAKGYISDPKSKAKSVHVTDEGVERAQELFAQHFAQQK
jgi:hypothetical protein